MIIPDLKPGEKGQLVVPFFFFKARVYHKIKKGWWQSYGKQQQSPSAVRGQGMLEWYEALISAALVLVLIFSFFFRIIQVDGRSMVPTLTHGDKLIVWAAGYTPQRGDVVIVDSYTVYGKPLVKRIIAKGGDTISIDYDAGTVTVNGELLQED